jgi:murein DD-endopeptidase MepM/ murein hydrolase activator NlpD
MTVRQKRLRLTAILAVIAVLATASILATTSSTAYATSYPSWSAVVKARHNAKAKKAEVKHIKAIIRSLDAQVKATQADAVKKGTASQLAEQAYFEAATKQQALESQAVAADKQRKQSEQQAGQLAAQLARSGSNDFSLNLFLNSKDAGDLLDSIGNAGKISERETEIYEKAVQDKNTAQALTDQATVQSSILKKLKVKATAAFTIASQAADAASTALAASQAHRAELQAQLSALTTKLKLTEKKYLKGVRARYGASAGLGAGQIAASGWAKPAIGVITAGFGYRHDPAAGGAWRLHTGTDLAAGCNIPIYAAHTGNVIYAGWNGTLGNWILIQDADGTQTGYGHIVNGGMLVRAGQHVTVGQNIARTGMTGGATGCHLHFEVRPGGVPVNAVPFMRARGIILG